MNKDHKNYITYIESEIQSNINAFWNYTSKLKTNNNFPNTLYYNESEAKPGQYICNLFAQYFESVYVN